MAAGQPQLTLYGSEWSPFVHRVILALDAARAKYRYVEIDLSTPRPEWYTKHIDPEGMVPVLVVGGPEGAPVEGPLLDGAVALKESLVQLELIADLFPDARLLPADPILRAKARLFMARQEAVLEGNRIFNFRGGSADPLLKEFDAVQRLLPAEGFAAGEYSIADAAALAGIMLIVLTVKSGKGFWVEEEYKKVADALGSPRFARLRRYIDDGSELDGKRTKWNKEHRAKMWDAYHAFLAAKRSTQVM